MGEGETSRQEPKDPLVSAMPVDDGLEAPIQARNHYPAIDVLHSVSRVMPAVTESDHRAHASKLRRLLAVYEKARDLINIGLYVKGSDAEIDEAIELMPRALEFLQQDTEPTDYNEAKEWLRKILAA